MMLPNAIALFASTLFVSSQLLSLAGQGARDVVGLAAKATDPRISSDGRGAALSVLEAADPAEAVRVAGLLLSDQDAVLRVRAAWILGDAGIDRGLSALKDMARSKREESNLAIIALGRLRDADAHVLLRGLLDQELTSTNPRLEIARVSALTKALGDYSDKQDAGLLARAVQKVFSPADWPMVNDLGKTGGREAIPLLEEIFLRTGSGGARVAAGVGLARCGLDQGLEYVRLHLRVIRPGTESDSRDGSSQKAGSETEEARETDFIFRLLGVPADTALVPDLIRIVAGKEYPDRTKALAWDALLRIDAPTYAREVARLAWLNTTFISANRFIALYDRSNGERAVKDETSERQAVAQGINAVELKRALAASRQERRQWRETHDYPL